MRDGGAADFTGSESAGFTGSEAIVGLSIATTFTSSDLDCGSDCEGSVSASVSLGKLGAKGEEAGDMSSIPEL